MNKLLERQAERKKALLKSKESGKKSATKKTVIKKLSAVDNGSPLQKRQVLRKAKLAVAIAHVSSEQIEQNESLEKSLVALDPLNLVDLQQCQTAISVHVARLHEMKTLDEKQAYKSKILPDFDNFLKTYRDEGEEYPNSVAVMCTIWQLDVGNIEVALDWAFHLIDQDIHKMPKNFKSNMPTWLLDNVYDWANKKHKEKQSAKPYLGKLLAAFEAGKWDVHLVPAGKIYGIAAKHAFDINKDPKRALELAEKATAINDSAGVKGYITKAKKALEKA